MDFFGLKKFCRSVQAKEQNSDKQIRFAKEGLDFWIYFWRPCQSDKQETGCDGFEGNGLQGDLQNLMRDREKLTTRRKGDKERKKDQVFQGIDTLRNTQAALNLIRQHLEADPPTKANHHPLQIPKFTSKSFVSSVREALPSQRPSCSEILQPISLMTER
jgi:hypothetical protein